MEAYGADINDQPCSLPRNKHILDDGNQLLLEFKNGLPYLCCRKPTETEINSLPHITMTSDVNWDPKQYDITFNEIKHLLIPHK
jgi:hypothetical protein